MLDQTLSQILSELVRLTRENATLNQRVQELESRQSVLGRFDSDGVPATD